MSRRTSSLAVLGSSVEVATSRVRMKLPKVWRRGPQPRPSRRWHIAAYALSLLAGVLGLALPAAPQSAPNAPIPSTMFGMHIHADALTGTPWPTVSFGGIRLWDTQTSWTYLNPARGVYDWTKLDQWLDLAESRHVDVVYTFGVTPSWAAFNPNQTCEYHAGACSPPADLRDWETFVRAVVTHVNGRVKYWEIWNEPNLAEFWSGDVAGVARLAQSAYPIIKSIDPTAVVLTPAGTAQPPGYSTWLNSYFAAGGGSYADVVAFHGYQPASSLPERLNGLIGAIKKVMSQNGLADKPLWDTEGSWGTADKLPDPDAQAAYVARTLILQWSAGVQRVYWYAWNNTLWGTLWDKSTGTVLEPGVAFGEVYKWLTGATLAAPCTVSADLTWTCTLSRPGDYEAEVVWNAGTSGGATRSFDVDPQYAQYRDLSGNVITLSSGTVQIGSQPILLEPLTALTLSSSYLQFDETPVGLSAQSKAVTLKNTGAVPVLLAGTASSAEYPVANACGDQIPVGGSCEMRVGFRPAAAGQRNGSLLIYDNAPGSPHSVFLTNRSITSSILVSPTSLDFSGQMVGATASTKSVTVSNVSAGSIPLPAASIDATGSDFAISRNSCPSVLDPGVSCSVTVTFSPKAIGTQSAVLRLASAGNAPSVAVSGAGWDFNLRLRDSTPVSLSSRTPGSYTLDVAPDGGFEGVVTLAVTCNAPALATCSVSPSTVDLNGTSAASIQVKVSTVSSASMGFLGGLASLLLFSLKRGRRPQYFLILLVLCLAGCAATVGPPDSGTSASSLSSIVVSATGRGGTRTLTLPVAN